jgi:hypothetical protein
MSLFYVIIIPVAIHLKCIYFDRSAGYVEGDYEHNKGIVQNSCECDIVYPSKGIKLVELVWILFTVMVGVYVTVFTLYEVFFAKENIK